MTLFEEPEVQDPLLARAKELYCTVDGFGECVYTMEEIIRTLQNEGWEDAPKSRSTISVWKEKYGWEKERSALISHALMQKKAVNKKSQSKALASIDDLTGYVEKIGQINKSSALMIEKWIKQLSEKPAINEKEASILTKIMDSTGRTYDMMVEKLAQGEKEKAVANHILEHLSERKVIDVEVG